MAEDKAKKNVKKVATKKAETKKMETKKNRGGGKIEGARKGRKMRKMWLWLQMSWQ